MSAGTVIEVGKTESGADRRSAVPVLAGEDLRARYDQLVELVLRVGAWLNGPQARMLSPEEWEAHFSRYQLRLAEVRRLGDQIRPVSLRERQDLLTGDALVDEVLELFAA